MKFEIELRLSTLIILLVIIASIAICNAPKSISFKPAIDAYLEKVE